VRTDDAEFVLPVGREPGNIETPEPAFNVGPLTGDGTAIDRQQRRALERRLERGLYEEPFMVGSRNDVVERASIPVCSPRLTNWEQPDRRRGRGGAGIGDEFAPGQLREIVVHSVLIIWGSKLCLRRLLARYWTQVPHP